MPEKASRLGESEGEERDLEDLDIDDEESAVVRGGRLHEDDEQQDISYL